MLHKDNNFSVLHYLNDNEIFRNTTVSDFSFNYNSEMRCATFGLTGTTLLGESSIYAVDNNIAFDNDIFTFTSGAVIQESPNGILASKVDLVCGSDLYEPTKDRWEDPISIRIFNSGTYQLYDEFEIKLNKSSNNSGFSSWMFTCATSDGRSTIMFIKDGALELNNVGTGRRSDLNLLALMFIFKTASLNVKCLSNDGSVIDSFKTFESYETNG